MSESLYKGEAEAGWDRVRTCIQKHLEYGTQQTHTPALHSSDPLGHSKTRVVLKDEET